MCVNTCLAYTGPFSEDETCHYCAEPRYEPIAQPRQKKKIARQQFYTFPVGYQLQGQCRTVIGSQNLEHRQRETTRIQAEIQENGRLANYNDFYCGKDYLDAVGAGNIKDRDICLMFSIDGAQLYQHKKSDCWIYIWVNLNLPPELR